MQPLPIVLYSRRFIHPHLSLCGFSCQCVRSAKSESNDLACVPVLYTLTAAAASLILLIALSISFLFSVLGGPGGKKKTSESLLELLELRM